ncbi:glycosyltransferase [Ginsengibacter hankyongi]|uniref:Glycosyltransferase n=1 Tax=Ginsengibacter hankyongi TaxID=2607284 RepID=A0A5J5IFS4_9BACT|nr:glycosyltransferase family 4 protein [Ginsengibacter hankyongi]KAA9036396.1 glycosyltransferase [Ginsengibacter hankyongi]
MKRVLIIVPFEKIYPPINGGMQRFFHIIHQLAIHAELTLITKQEKAEFLLAKDEYPAIENVNILSTKDAPKPKDIFNLLPEKLQKALRYRWYKKNIKGPADGDYLDYYPIVKELLQKEKFYTVILESPATLNAASLIRKYDKKAKIIFDAHNVNTNLDAAFLEKKEISSARYLNTRRVESELYKTVDGVLACSKKDKDDFDSLNDGKLAISVIPNGVTVNDKLCDAGVRSENPEHILFCGYLSSRPNSEGLYWFYRSIWPMVQKAYPQLKLLVVGSGKLPAEMNDLLNDEGLIFTGSVEDVKPYYSQSAISIVPLKTGSGTRLKILEAMSFGVPVVSTSQGAEGIDYTNGFDIIIADEEQLFAEQIIHLLKDNEQRLMIQKNARALVERKYDWNIIGHELLEVINLIDIKRAV